MSSSSQAFRQLEKTTISKGSGEFDDPLVAKDGKKKTSESGGAIRTESTEPGIGIVLLQSFHPREYPNMDACLNPPTTKPTASPSHHSISPSTALPCDPGEQAINRDDCGEMATAHPSHVITVLLPLPGQYQDLGDSALNEKEREIAGIVDETKERGL
ncbi:hypothetical protein ACLMJK_009413 [Lecanora helva]